MAPDLNRLVARWAAPRPKRRTKTDTGGRPAPWFARWAASRPKRRTNPDARTRPAPSFARWAAPRPTLPAKATPDGDR